MISNEMRFVRSGCRLNAGLRPVISPESKTSACKAVEQATNMPQVIPAEASSTIGSGMFALRDLHAREEVVL